MYFNYSINATCLENNKLQINTVNFRDYAINKHNQVDDYPYGEQAHWCAKA